MRIGITGSHGLVGSALVPFLVAEGHQVTRIVRTNAGKGEISWDPAKGILAAADLEGLQGLVHLAGEGIAERRWTGRQKEVIRTSRVGGTQLLSETIARMEEPPGVLVSASAIGYYGDRGDHPLDESSSPGKGFLAEVAQAWEQATQSASDAGIRVIKLRFGVILSENGGALAKMLGPFRLGGGGVVGSGSQYLSWISIDDAIGVIHHALTTDSLSGAVNAVAPQAVTNREFTKTLGKVLSRPTLVPMPAFAARLAFGEMADELLLASARVEPRNLIESGYRFRYACLEEALRHLLSE